MIVYIVIMSSTNRRRRNILTNMYWNRIGIAEWLSEAFAGCNHVWYAISLRYSTPHSGWPLPVAYNWSTLFGFFSSCLVRLSVFCPFFCLFFLGLYRFELDDYIVVIILGKAVYKHCSVCMYVYLGGAIMIMENFKIMKWHCQFSRIRAP